MVPWSILGKKTNLARGLATAAVIWGVASTAMSGVNNWTAAYALRFFVGLGEAGFAPIVPFYLSRMYTKRDLGTRAAMWLTAAPLGGFVNGIIAYGVAFITNGPLTSWRILYLIEGLGTIVLAAVAFFVLPGNLDSKWFTQEEQDFLIERRSHEMAFETTHINWKQARAVVYRWQSVFRGCEFPS